MSYGAAVTRRLRAMGIRDRPITPRSPWQNGHVERLIGSIRRECLDHVVVLGERHLRHLLANYAAYYNGGAHAPCTRQGYTAPSTRADSRACRMSHLARRSPSVLRSDRIIGRHRWLPRRDYIYLGFNEDEAVGADRLDLRVMPGKLRT